MPGLIGLKGCRANKMKLWCFGNIPIPSKLPITCRGPPAPHKLEASPSLAPAAELITKRALVFFSVNLASLILWVESLYPVNAAYQTQPAPCCLMLTARPKQT